MDLDRPFEVALQPPGPPTWPSLELALDADAAKGKVFVSALHGGAGEDGTVQSLMEARHICFTGSGSEASRAAMNKWRAKALVKRKGIRVAESELVIELDRAEEKLRACRERYGSVVVKPVSEGSTVGVHFVASEADLPPAVAAVRESFPGGYMVEALVDGVELTVGVVEDREGIRALPCSEVRLEAGRRFDYAGKYLGAGTKEITPAEVPEAVARSAQEVAVEVHRTLGCSGYSRTDIIVNGRGPVFLEINTLPGLTRASFIPQQLDAAGISMEAFLAGQIELARRRYP